MRAVLVSFVLLTLACTTSAGEEGKLLSPEQAHDAPEEQPEADAGLPATPPTKDGGEAGSPISPPPPPSVDDGHAACAAAVNAARAQLGLAALKRDPSKEPCADQQAKVDATHGSPHWAYLHGAPNCLEDPVLDRQNECPGWYVPAAKAAPDCVAKMLAEGPGGGHYDVIANPAYTRVACGLYVDPSAPASSSLWLTLNFY